jgi:hypothetical protein
MIIKTKKTKLENKTYIRQALINVNLELWWVWLIPLGISALTFFYTTVWFIIIAVVLSLLYLLFWLAQFIAVTQLEQNKVMFEKMTYEIDSRQIIMKLNTKQGMPMNWDMIKKVRTGKEAYTLILSKAQLIYLPKKAFNSDNEIKFFESILKRKSLIK